MTTDIEVLSAIAERMNRLTQVSWDRCVMHDASAAAYGWIDRSDGRSDFVLLDFQWGTTTGLASESVRWLAVGFSTSSAEFSASMFDQLELGDGHKDCERIEDVFGKTINRRARGERRT